MDYNFYLKQFENAANQLDQKILKGKGVIIETGYWLNSVVLRMQKMHWANNPDLKPQTESAIFYSIWMNDKDIAANKLWYNIHAIKLRQLKGYSIKGKQFAADFRNAFIPFKLDWLNVSLDFGPLTLMQGWIDIDLKNVEKNVLFLANQFLTIDFLVDNLLENYKM